MDPELKVGLKIMFECGVKLEARLETMTSAAVYYHKFYKVYSPVQFDPFLIGATCIYLAGKVEENHFKPRDLINVFTVTTDKSRKEKPLDFDDHYWNLRETIVNMELLLLRVLRFDVSYAHPHRFLLHYLRSLTEWLNLEYKSTIVFCQTCWAILNDYFMNPKFLDYSPHHIAIAVIKMALEIMEIQIPSSNEALLCWNEAFCEDLSKEKIWEIISSILTVYEDDGPRAHSSRTCLNSNYMTKNVTIYKQYVPSNTDYESDTANTKM